MTHIRPRFEFIVPMQHLEVISKIKSKLESSPSQITGHISNDLVTLDIIPSEVHYWSPQLNFRVEEAEDNKQNSKIAGLIGPRPNVWTLFVFIYFSVGIISFFISLFAASKYMLGQYTPMIWAFPIGIIFMLTAFRVGKYGENLGRDQSKLFKDFLKDIVDFEDLDKIP